VYGLREHQVFQQPHVIGRTGTIVETAMDKWRHTPSGETDEVAWLPLVADRKARWRAGWCTLLDNIGDSPDVEVLCGGMNSKGPDYAAIWRQGNLLHFGFEQDPGQMIARGRRLLVNSIVYAAKFGGDRPLVETVPGWNARSTTGRLASALRYRPSAERIASLFAEPHHSKLAAQNLPAIEKWIEQQRGYLVFDANGKVTLDRDATALQLRLHDATLPERLAAALEAPTTRAAALALARRHIDAPLADDADAEAWRTFLTGNAAYLFHLETPTRRWHLDPVAKQRGVPCAKFRGPARATADRR